MREDAEELGLGQEAYIASILSFVECHGLSVTRSKAAAGRQKKAAYIGVCSG